MMPSFLASVQQPLIILSVVAMQALYNGEKFE